MSVAFFICSGAAAGLLDAHIAACRKVVHHAEKIFGKKTGRNVWFLKAAGRKNYVFSWPVCRKAIPIFTLYISID